MNGLTQPVEVLRNEHRPQTVDRDESLFLNMGWSWWGGGKRHCGECRARGIESRAGARRSQDGGDCHGPAGNRRSLVRGIESRAGARRGHHCVYSSVMEIICPGTSEFNSFKMRGTIGIKNGNFTTVRLISLYFSALSTQPHQLIAKISLIIEKIA